MNTSGSRLPQEPIRVLMVEDNSVDARLIQSHFAHSERGFSLEHEVTLSAALQRLKQGRVDVILLDLTLPDSSGLNTFTRIFARAAEIPIVILSGQEDAELAVKAVREGAQDYLRKSKIDSQSLTHAVRYAIERSRRQRAEKELSAAGAIQKRLLPRVAPHVAGFDISGQCDPAEFAGGDYYDFFAMRGSHLGVVVADVSGHGLGPALTMSETRAVLRTLAPLSPDVGDILTRASRVLASDLVGNAFVAVFLASIQPATRTLRFASAGQPGFVLDASGRIKRLLKSNNPPIGVDKGTKYATSGEITLEDGESLFAFTDGMTESANSLGQAFGKKQLFEIVRGGYNQSAERIIGTLFDKIRKFLHGNSRRDDMTALIVKVQPAEAKTATGPGDAQTRAMKSFKHFAVEELEQAVVLRLHDAELLGTQVCQELQTELVAFARRKGLSRLVISFHEVTRFSSETINSLLRARDAMLPAGGQMKLCQMKPEIRQAFAALNLDGPIFEIHDGLDDAIGSF